MNDHPLDLLGEPARPTPKRTRQRGYAAWPGTGPAGETCGTCEHLLATRSYAKCWKVRDAWTNGRATDVRRRSPACRFWEPQND